MRVNLFCCFKSPTTDDNSSQSSSSTSRRNSVSISAPLQAQERPPVLALGTEVRAVPVPEIFVERIPFISDLGTPERVLSLSPQSLSPQSRSPLEVSPTLSRATYVTPNRVTSSGGTLQEDLIRARAKLISTNSKAAVELRDHGQEPDYMQVLENFYDDLGDPVYQDVDEASNPTSATNPIVGDDETYISIYANELDLAALGERPRPIGSSNPSIYFPENDADYASIAGKPFGGSNPSVFQLMINVGDADRTPTPGSGRSQATALTPPPQRRITAAEFLGVPDEYGLGTGQFGDGSYSIG